MTGDRVIRLATAAVVCAVATFAAVVSYSRIRTLDTDPVPATWKRGQYCIGMAGQRNKA